MPIHGRRLDVLRRARSERGRYPGAIVVPIAVLTVFRPDLGLALLLRAALLGGAVFALLGGDTRAEQVTPSEANSHLTPSGSHFDRDAPERMGSTTTNAITLFGVGLFVLAGTTIVLAVVM